MSNNYGLTPEQFLRKKKRNKYILYLFVFTLTALISAFVTLFVSKI